MISNSIIDGNLLGSMNSAQHAAALTPGEQSHFKYSICTLVTRPLEYAEMVDSFVTAGFDPASCEYLYIDNSRENQCDAFAGYNLFLNTARGRYIILCHQDILLKYDRREHLDRAIKELDQIDPAWAALGNAGGVTTDIVAARLTDASGNHHTGCFPLQVSSLDENFILVKRDANLCLSHDLSGFHLYGTDICQLARIIGWTTWVIDFNLFHKSGGHRDAHFYEVKEKMIRKYQAALRTRFVQTTCTHMCLSGSQFWSWLRNDGYRKMLFEQIYQGRKRQRIPKTPVLCSDDKLLPQLGKGWYSFYWLVYKITRPFLRLKRHLKQRFFRSGLNSSRPNG